MRGDDQKQEAMFSYISPEKRVPADHPLRGIRKMVDEILKEMSPKFCAVVLRGGAAIDRAGATVPVAAVADLLFGAQRANADRATAVQPAVPVVCGDGDGREVWNHAVFSKNRERLLNEEIAEAFFRRVLERGASRTCRMNISRWMGR